jgi:hypothetical protein
MNIKYYDEEEDLILYDIDMIFNLLSISRSKAQRTIKRLGINHRSVYKNRFLYTELDIELIKDYISPVEKEDNIYI